MVIEENRSALSVCMTLIEYSAWGVGTLLLVWGSIHYKNRSKWKRFWLAFVWVFVIMCAASTLDMFYGQRVYSGKQRTILLVEFVLLFVSASFMTYRSVRRAGSIKNGASGQV